MRANNPYLKVHFEIESHKATDILLPIDLLEHSAIPCHSIVLDNPNTEVNETIICEHVKKRATETLSFHASVRSAFADFAVHDTHSRSVFRFDDTRVRFQGHNQVLSAQELRKETRRGAGAILQNVSQSAHAGTILHLNRPRCLACENLTFLKSLPHSVNNISL